MLWASSSPLPRSLKGIYELRLRVDDLTPSSNFENYYSLLLAAEDAEKIFQARKFPLLYPYSEKPAFFFFENLLESVFMLENWNKP